MKENPFAVWFRRALYTGRINLELDTTVALGSRLLRMPDMVDWPRGENTGPRVVMGPLGESNIYVLEQRFF